MSQNKLESRKASKEMFEEATENRIDQLINVTEKYARTERHLEKDLPFTSPEAKANEEKIQKEREEEICNLKNIIAHGEHQD